ncbi:hypothetical protein [Bradyrhizobium sp. STM 3566]|uniref:hypothetical protein n=1 Tax=Bradyrhizobium sp. STM 3566 TaxID=578928 RepID=UPI00388E764B
MPVYEKTRERSFCLAVAGGRRSVDLAGADELSVAIARVAKDLGEDEDWLWDVANGMDTEDGVIWVYGIGDDQVMAFTDFGIENLTELIRMHKDDPELLKRWDR